MMRTMDGRRRAACAVAARRGDLELTQQQLADRAKVSARTIGNLESLARGAGRWPIAANRVKIAKALEWDGGMLDFLASPPDDSGISPELRALIEREVPDPQRAADAIRYVEETAALARDSGRPSREENGPERRSALPRPAPVSRARAVRP